MSIDALFPQRYAWLFNLEQTKLNLSMISKKISSKILENLLFGAEGIRPNSSAGSTKVTSRPKGVAPLRLGLHLTSWSKVVAPS